LDVYYPDCESYPVFVYFHGGGLQFGDKRDAFAEKMAKYLNDRGIAYVSANYRMFPNANYPDFVRDAASAVAWVKNNLPAKGANGKIYVGGTNGLYCIDSRQCKRIADINNICWTLCEGDGGLLAATSSGIYKITRDGAVSRLTSNATTAMLVEDDTVYVAEPDGVWLYQSGRRTKVDNLPLVTEIRKDAHGNLWLKNVHGETRGIDPGKRKKPMDDLPKQLLKPVSDIDVKAQYRYGHQIWIGGDEILAIIDTEKQDLAKLTDCRTVRFRSIVMRGDSVLWGGYGDMPKTLPSLSSNEGHLHFYYALD
jgi:ligand-binding sensor domain-containing protein